jgi:hypothetical protein
MYMHVIILRTHKNVLRMCTILPADNSAAVCVCAIKNFQSMPLTEVCIHKHYGHIMWTYLYYSHKMRCRVGLLAPN